MMAEYSRPRGRPTRATYEAVAFAFSDAYEGATPVETRGIDKALEKVTIAFQRNENFNSNIFIKTATAKRRKPLPNV